MGSGNEFFDFSLKVFWDVRSLGTLHYVERTLLQTEKSYGKYLMPFFMNFSFALDVKQNNLTLRFDLIL